ncbi:uncharacterized protein HD556DRAFT_1310959 [Suillus plorans]|uniref:Uncharacterized protein n=1 Tax=Suillus plorans TaxID=116603 RepID=A0A9P7AI32_9AGAM|nr:uncharacterized protein HD556DRAFT_1310959 [Suillus plorans]KAG1789965.1 hypothetical protein HD556DRAFT_1310959 [Suillus plorans]
MSFKIPFFIESVHSSSYVYVNHAVSTAAPDVSTVHKHSLHYQAVVRSIADESLLHCYKGVYYNMPAEVKDGQSLFYVVRGSYIGVMAGCTTRENALNCVLGVNEPAYHEVESVVIGEQRVREAIDQGIVEMVEPWGFSYVV